MKFLKNLNNVVRACFARGHTATVALGGEAGSSVDTNAVQDQM